MASDSDIVPLYVEGGSDDELWGGDDIDNELDDDFASDEEPIYDHKNDDDDEFLSDEDDGDDEIEDLFDINKEIEKSDNIVDEDDRLTSDFIYLEELTNLISTRAAHIEGGSTPLVKVERQDTPKDIAVRELLAHQLPLYLIRQIGDKKEIFDPNKMAFDKHQLPA